MDRPGRRGGRIAVASVLAVLHRLASPRHRPAPELHGLPGQPARVLRGLCGAAAAREKAPDARDHRAAGRPLHAHLHRPRPALDGHLQLHRVRAPRRAPRPEPVQLRAVGHPLRRDLRIRRDRLDPRRDGVRAAVHALQLSLRGSRHRRRGMGDEGGRGGGVHMRAVAHLALCGRARAQSAVRAARSSARTRSSSSTRWAARTTTS